MTSMYDEPGTTNAGHWPGRERRRAAGQVDTTSTPTSTPTPARPAGQWLTHEWSDLDAVDVATLLNVPTRIGLNVEQLASTFATCRNRYGWAVMVGVVVVDALGDPAVILGETVVRWHIIPVNVDDLPAAVRGDR